jgi:hypothetical protein
MRKEKLTAQDLYESVKNLEKNKDFMDEFEKLMKSLANK